MRTLSAAVAAAIAKPVVPLAQLLFLDLSTPQRLNTSAWDLTWGSFVWSGALGIGKIEQVQDSPGEVSGMQFSLIGVDSAHIATALAEPLQGKVATLYTAIFDDVSYQVLDAYVEWSGFLDQMPIREQGNEAMIAVTAEHAGIDLIRPRVVKYSAADQARIDATDRAFEFVVDQAERPIVWPASTYFQR